MPKDTATQAVTIYAALAKAQAEMGRAVKDADNPHFRSKYADLAAVQDACMPALTKHGFSVFQPIGRDEHGLHVRTILAHESGETLECTVPLIGFKQDMQGLGSATTYARRYGLLCMSGVAPEDDDGNAASRPRPTADDPPLANEPPRVPPSVPLEVDCQSKIDGAVSLSGLALAWTQVNAAFNNRVPPALIARKDERKAALSAGDPQAPADPTEPPF